MTDRDANTLSEGVIVSLIMRAARQCNDPEPTSIEYVYGTRKELTHGSILGADGDAPSVLVAATGNFSMVLHGPVPYPDATGSVILLIIDQETGNVTDQGIGDRPVDLAPLGPVYRPAVPNS